MDDHQSMLKILGWILEPCSYDKTTFGPEAPKGVIVLSAQDQMTVARFDQARHLDRHLLGAAIPSIVDAYELFPGEDDFNHIKGMASHTAPSVVYLVKQDMTLKCLGGF